MTQISILSGFTADAGVDFRTSYPKNLVPVPAETGVSSGYLRTAEGIKLHSKPNPNLKGRGRGRFFWNGLAYWVIGSDLCSMSEDGTMTIIGYVGDNGLDVTFTKSFDRIGIASAKSLYYWDGIKLVRVSDPNLGDCIDVVWMDGYFVSTDGDALVVTDLNDPMTVNVLRYGSSEADPDPIVGVMKLRQELYAFNRNTIEIFDNVGGTGFPFARNVGAMIEKGAVGTKMFCRFDQVLAFVGGSDDEPCSVWLGAGGAATKIATREIEDVLLEYTEDELAASTLVTRMSRRHQNLTITLPRHTLVYDAAASLVLEAPVWYSLHSSPDLATPFHGRHFLFAYNKWFVDDREQPRIGLLDKDLFTQYGQDVGWQFDTVMVYNESRAAILHSVELIGAPGRANAYGVEPVLFFSWTTNGVTWGTERMIGMGRPGQRNKRLAYRPKVRFEQFMSMRYRGANASIVSFMRLEAELEPLNA